MNLVKKAIQDCSRAIPTAILKEAFLTNDYFRSNSIGSLDDRIYHDVYKSHVADDLNMTSGQTRAVSLEHATTRILDTSAVQVTIPPASLNGLSIVSIHSVNYFRDVATFSSFLSGRSGNDLINLGQSAVDRVSGIPLISTNDVVLLSDNTFMMKGLNKLPLYSYALVTLEHNDGLTNIPVQLYPVFRELFILAVKAYCYNKLIIEVDEARLSGGRALGSFKEKLDEYSDAWELYTLMLKEKWVAASIHGDDVRNREFLQMITAH